MSDGRSGKFSLEQQDYTELENAVYFTQKCISLVMVLGDLLKPRDLEVFEKVK